MGMRLSTRMRSSEYQENKKGRKNYTYDILGVDENNKKTQAFHKKDEKRKECCFKTVANG